jgi:hypothetical protein
MYDSTVAKMFALSLAMYESCQQYSYTNEMDGTFSE